jgi:LytS/YehU family sensor histidine kinase
VWDKAKAEEQQKENIKTELSFLRSQISPHFLFNVLNNIVAMVRLKSNDLEDTVVKLSTLLQYMLYETDEEKVLLRNEIEYLESYIDLQSQRFGNKIQIIKNFSVADTYQTIEPMLLIPFVENAFKHGYGLIKNPVIDISLKTTNDGLVFEVKNKYDDTNLQKDKTSGIGLTNVKRRLELLYHNDYQLLISQKENWFMVKLSLQLKNTPIGVRGNV